MAEHTDRVGKLREMAAKIATEMELGTTNLLEDEVEELGKRLENVRLSISILADIAEARNNNELECNQNIDDVKANLNNMKTVSLCESLPKSIETLDFLYPIFILIYRR